MGETRKAAYEKRIMLDLAQPAGPQIEAAIEQGKRELLALGAKGEPAVAAEVILALVAWEWDAPPRPPAPEETP